MRKFPRLVLLLLSLTFQYVVVAQNASFTTPDTVCISQPVNIANVSNASSYYWNFCVADILNTPPTGTNLGSVGGVITWPVFSDFVEADGNFYVFVVNHSGSSLGIARLDFGTSLLNTPTGVNLGNFSGTLRERLEGIQVINENGKWYAFVVGGDPDYGNVPQIVRVDFGNDIANPNPIATDLGNLGDMYQPLDLYMFKENGIWHGVTVNKDGSITRFAFNNGIEGVPQAQNYDLGLSYPTGINVINDGGSWYGFVTTATNNSIARLEFGNSLLNNPTVFDLGNPGNTLIASRDLYLMRFCNEIVGFVVNGPYDSEGSQLVRLDFHNNLQAVPDATLLGKPGDLDFPHSISKLFRVNDRVYSFITNVNNKSITRLEFPSCSNASQSGFIGRNPPAIKYNAPGIYNINLTIDDGLPSQSSFCKQVVIVPEPVHTPLQTIVLPPSGAVKIGTANPSGNYQWFPAGLNSDSITVNNEGLYIVETDGYGCSNRDSFMVVRQTNNSIQFTAPDTVCVGTPVNITNAPASALSYYWNFCVSNVNETVPTGINLGNVGNKLTGPVFMDYAYHNGNYYGFVVNRNPTSLVRLNFGNNLLNTPTVTDLNNLGGVLPTGIWGEGIQLIQSQGRWYAIIVGGSGLGTNSGILKVEFGTDLANPNPVATNWGNIGGALDQPIDLHIFQQGTNWYGLTTNAENNTLTRFNFGSNFTNPPTVDNLGNVGGLLSYPTGVYAIGSNNDWKVFVVNGGDRTRSSGSFSLVRLNFGTSLLNTPTAVNLGNPDNLLQHPRDITFLQSCGQIIGFTVNGHLNNSNITKYDFANDLSVVPTASDLGNIGNLSFPHAFSKLFREGDNLYAFIINVDNSTITRLQFSGCTNSSIPSSTAATPPPITYNAPGIYNINLTVDDGLATQASFCRQVVVVPEPLHTPIKTIIIRVGESVKIGTGNISGEYKWNTTNVNADSITVNQEGLYFVETSGYGCSNIDSFRIIFTTADFSFQQDPCNPLKVIFKNETPGSTIIDWDFGNGSNAPGNDNPIVSYALFDNYNVTLTVKNAGGNNVSVTKSITVQVKTDSLIITNDTTICNGSNIQLNAIAALSYCWSPSESLSKTDIANPVAFPSETTKYYLHSQVTGVNLIKNGDFSDGNVLFTSEYDFRSPNNLDGQYFVGARPKDWNPSMSDCSDHTSGNGNMFLVNGSPLEDVKVWSQTISVTPNTNYAFSTWIQALYSQNPAQLQFYINGNTIGNLITANLPNCTWSQYYTIWNSGNNTTATIAVVNKNTETIVWGNDFALDDISFAPVFIKRDSITITVEKPVITARTDTTLCQGNSVQMDVSGDADHYQWSPAAGLSQTDGVNPIAMPFTSTAYIVTGTTLNGCEAKDTVNVTVNPAPIVNLTNNTVICPNSSIQLIAGGGESYQWRPSSTLSAYNVSNPVASPVTATTYFVKVTDGNNCSANDSVTINIRDYPVFTASGNASICEGESAKLSATGGHEYQWSPTTGLNDEQSASPVASPTSTTQYSVYIKENNCDIDTTIQVRINVNPTPSINAYKSNDINCVVRTAQLTATGAVSYIWSPGVSLDYANRYNPIAGIDTTTLFTVKGTTEYGCSATDTIRVKVTAEGNPLFVLPNVFTPNGDRLNDCFGLAKWGRIQLQELSVYNRWGEKVFSTNNPAACWDGTYKGIQQTGTFVYKVKAKTFCGPIDRKGTVTIIR